MNENFPDIDRLIGQEEILRLVPVSRVTLIRWESAGRFPRRITLARNRVAWRMSEIQAWIASQNTEPVEA